MFKRLLFRKNRIDFIVVGVQKAGTTALDLYLRQHPEIGMGKVKEIHFFDNEKYFGRKSARYNSYHEYFNFSDGKEVHGEVTPIYIWWNNSIKRIFQYNKNIKLIIILRNPINRAYSHWNMEVSRKKESRDFYSCISEVKTKQVQNRVTSYKERGFYSNQVKTLLNYFDKKKLLFIKYEDFLADQEDHLRKIFNFLEVSEINYNYHFQKSHKIQYETEIDQKSKSYLLDAYLNDIENVESLLGWNCNDWKV